jgi:uncharacterized protein (DUF1800 family)
MEKTDAAHLLRRAGFGGTAAQVDELAALSRSDAVERVLSTSGSPGVGPKPGVVDDDMLKYPQFVELFHDTFQRMAASPAPIVEKMALFWHGHFTTSLEKTYDPRKIYDQHVLWRQYALGNFRDFAQAMALNPAMLDYLDNRYSTQWGPNQNFARELMELFLLGVGNYTEADVETASYAWTGHSVADDDETYQFRTEWHDETARTFFGEAKVWDGPDMIDKIFDTRADVVAPFVARKMWSYFAYPNPDASIVADLAGTFTSSGWDIAAVMRAIFSRDEFYGDSAKQGLVRQPAEYLASVIRGLGVESAVIHPEWYQDGLGQTLFNPPDVSGWKQNNYWVSSATLGTKARMAQSVHWMLGEASVTNPIAALAALEPADAVDQAIALFTPDLRSTAHRDAMVAWLTDVKSRPEEEWTIVPFLTTLTLMLPELQLA